MYYKIDNYLVLIVRLTELITAILAYRYWGFWPSLCKQLEARLTAARISTNRYI